MSFRLILISPCRFQW